MTALGRVNARQLGLICRHALRHSLRSGSGLVFVLLAFFFSLTVANAILSPFELLVAQGEQQGRPVDAAVIEQRLVDFARPAVEWAVAPPAVDDAVAQRAAEQRTRRWVSFVLDEQPALLSAILFVLVFGMPLVIPFGAFSQTAGDIGNRGLRYLLVRTERANIYYGRLIATAALVVGVQVLIIATIALYLGFKVDVYGWAEIATWSSRGLLALALLSLPYVALCAWLSASQSSAMTALVVCNVVIGGVLLGAVLGRLAWEPAYAVRYVLPWGVQNKLLAPEAATVALTAGACLLYAALFTWLGARTFERRDL